MLSPSRSEPDSRLRYPRGPNAAYCWVAGKLFEAAVKGSGSSDVTSASVIKGPYSLKDETLGGLAPPLNYTPGQPNSALLPISKAGV